MRFELYEIPTGSHTGLWSWRLKESNGDTIATGGSYINRVNAEHAIDLIKNTNEDTPVVVTTS